MLMAEAVSRVAARTAGKESAATEAFAVALRRLPSAVADNAGYDSADLISRLRAHHAQGELTMGLGELKLNTRLLLSYCRAKTSVATERLKH